MEFLLYAKDFAFIISPLSLLTPHTPLKRFSCQWGRGGPGKWLRIRTQVRSPDETGTLYSRQLACTSQLLSLEPLAPNKGVRVLYNRKPVCRNKDPVQPREKGKRNYSLKMRQLKPKDTSSFRQDVVLFA